MSTNHHLFAVMPVEDKATPMWVRRVGFHVSLPRDHRISFPEGIGSYHAIFTMRGEIVVGKTRLGAGEAMLFLPNVPYEYVYTKGKDTLYAWIIFEGTAIATLLEQESPPHSLVLGDKIVEIEMLLRAMYDAPDSGISCITEYNAGLLYSLFSLMLSPPKSPRPFRRAVELLEGRTPRTVGELAALYGLSEGYFITAFRTVYGVPPVKYRLLHRLKQAAQLLETTALTVAEVAEATGFTDPFYFSHAFKRHYGKSPTAYRTTAP